MNFVEQLKEKAVESGSIVCMGMDPVLDKIPLKGDAEEVIVKFYTDILNAMISSDIKPGIVKPNYAFYAQYGFPGLRALKKLIELYHKNKFLIILDAKRGDIGKTSTAYAKEAFEFWKVDALTVAPYMGSDSVGPFIDFGKGVYILDRTSNPGAVDLQDMKVEGIPVYMKLAENIVKWHKPGVGAVVGATYPKELEEISSFFVKSGKNVPFLIPGVGKQGGSASDVAAALKKSGNDLSIHRINSSSGINFAYLKKETDDYAGAAVEVIKELNKEIGL
jgi:orotidine-5'-phosphate decarboxylase